MSDKITKTLNKQFRDITTGPSAQLYYVMTAPKQQLYRYNDLVNVIARGPPSNTAVYDLILVIMIYVPRFYNIGIMKAG